jgi:hypothetical protein
VGFLGLFRNPAERNSLGFLAISEARIACLIANTAITGARGSFVRDTSFAAGTAVILALLQVNAGTVALGNHLKRPLDEEA